MMRLQSLLRPGGLIRLMLLLTALLAVLAGPAAAQEISVGFGDDTTLTERAVQMVVLLTILSLAPSILVMVTSFTRIVVVLSLLRSAIGLQTAPPNMVMVSLALFLSAFIMMPTLQASYDAGVQPLIDGDIEFEQAFERASDPFRTSCCPRSAKRTSPCSRSSPAEKKHRKARKTFRWPRSFPLS